MNQILGIGYGFKESELKKRFSPVLSAVTWQKTQLKKPRKPDAVENWRILKSRKALNRAAQKLTNDPEIQMEFIRSAEPVLLVGIKSATRKMEDFTFYLPRHSTKDGAEEVLRHYQQDSKARNSYECKLRIWDERAHWFAEGRVLACWCSQGKSWSLTLRKERDSLGEKSSEHFLNNPEEIISLLSDRIFGKEIADKHGLVVVAGRTGVAKSKIVHGLIKNYMKAGESTGRTPHLLTYEDPIEEDIYKPDEKGKNYTPRQRGQDVNDIAQAINDALRQTSRIMFVGETRDPEQWNQLFHFAGTGHLVITTTHAGSLTEAVGNILQAVKAREPSARSIVADRLLAVIHLRRGKAVDRLKGKAVDLSFVLPALWLRTPIGAKALMAEGLASLLPNTPKALTDGHPAKASAASRNQSQADLPPSSIGRYWFARELVEQAKKASHKVKKKVEKEVLRRGLAWDLEGV